MQSEHAQTFVGENQVNLACFETDGRIYALDVSQVREIVRWQAVTPLPMAPRLIDGVIDLRGAVIPVVELSRVLGGEAAEVTEQSRIVVLDCDGLVLGLCVASATDVLSVDAGRLEDVPELASQAGYDAVRHVVRRPDAQPVMVISLEHILENVYKSAIAGPEDNR